MKKEHQIDLEESIAAVANDLAPRLEESVQARYLDDYGREKPNPTPMAPPIGYKKQPTIAEQMRQMIRLASMEAAQMGAETEDEANDFDVGEDMEPTTPYEHDFEPDPALEHMIALHSRSPAPTNNTAPKGQEVQAQPAPPVPTPPSAS